MVKECIIGAPSWTTLTSRNKQVASSRKWNCELSPPRKQVRHLLNVGGPHTETIMHNGDILIRNTGLMLRIMGLIMKTILRGSDECGNQEGLMWKLNSRWGHQTSKVILIKQKGVSTLRWACHIISLGKYLIRFFFVRGLSENDSYSIHSCIERHAIASTSKCTPQTSGQQ